MATTAKKFNPVQFLSFKGQYRVLHMTWFAFFLTFVAWFNMAPLATTMLKELSWLTEKDLKLLAICNVALTIPARIVIGMLLDRFGPRLCYSGLLIVMSIPCFIFAMADSLTQLVISRLLLGMIGAGFVIGIRMVSEWFPPREVGEAEGIYGGFGNFGSAAAAFVLPTVALDLIGGNLGWRWAIALTGIACFVYGFVYYAGVRDTPDGKTFHKAKRVGAMEVTSWPSLYGLMAIQIPMVGALGLLVWRLHDMNFLPTQGAHVAYGILVCVLLFQWYKAWSVNAPHLRKGYPKHDQYQFRQVGVLSLLYFANFGSELAVVSMLPSFFEKTWELTPQLAGAIAASYAFMNLVARPMGGWLSDRFTSRKRTLLVLTIGLAVGYGLMGMLDGAWPLVVAVIVTMACSYFVQAGEGAVFAVVPLVKKRLTGQVAGMAGAYGNVGAVTFLTIFAVIGDPHMFFYVIAGAAGLGVVACLLLKEPEGSHADDYHETKAIKPALRSEEAIGV